MRLGKSETSGGIAKSSQAIFYNWITLIIMQFLHIDHLFSHSFCAIIPSLVSKAVLKEAFYNNNGEANFRSAEINTLNDVSFFVFLFFFLPLHCLFTRKVILYPVTVLISCSFAWEVVI